jgi:hypothetical protein
MNTMKTNSVKVTDPWKHFLILLIGSAIGATFIAYMGIAKKYWKSATVLLLTIALSYLLLYSWIFTDSETEPNTTSQLLANQLGVDKVVSGSIHVQPDTFPDSKMVFNGTEVPVMGPLDGLSPKDVVTRLNYLYEKTSYPYRPLKFTDYKTSSDTTLIQQKSSLLTDSQLDTPEFNAEMSRWYPATTRLQVNTRDCTNYAAGTPGSCNLDTAALLKFGTDKSQLIVHNYDAQNLDFRNGSGVYDKSASHGPTNVRPLLDNKTQKLEEGFQNMNSVPKSLKLNNDIGVLFHNAPGNADFDVEALNPPSMNGTMCRGCKVGKCRRAVCGSRFFEPGNDNIINIKKYITDYLDDDSPSTPVYQEPTSLRLARG